MDESRVRKLNDREGVSGPVVYWMNREQRVDDNWALIYAQQLAIEHKQSLVIVFNLDPSFLGGGERQFVFKMSGLEDVSKQSVEKNISFKVVLGGAEEVIGYINKNDAGALVTDMSPLRIQKEWLRDVLEKMTIPVWQVDAHNIIPVWVTSDKQEYAARTIRPKIYRHIENYLVEIPNVKKHPFGKSSTDFDPEKIQNYVQWDHEVSVVEIAGGARAAKKLLKEFLENRIENYADNRNDPLVPGQSGLSPYLHYGHIAPARVALEVVKQAGRPITKLLDPKKNMASSSSGYGAFLEEMIVRRELSDNFCFYNNDYDRLAGAPDWAQKTLEKHRNNEREYVYTKNEFEQAQTHDPLWNAAQREMVQTGKMHGYLRMYWAKKILEWTNTPEYAVEVAVYLNDRYELDGRDPNGYAGILWSIGGLHDRPWFERPIFGTVRYMARSGMDKKFDTKAYIAKWQEN